MGYIQDETWQMVKKVAKKNGFVGDWILIIHSYYEYGGNHVQIHTTINGESYRILRLLDSREILLLDRKGNPVIYDYETVNDGQKSFFYNDMEEKEIEIPNGRCLNDKTRIKIYV
ncbi:hypothetical protein kochi14H1_0130 [Enterococcus phage phi EF14H1]|uniref:Phage protein n=5 Tax=Kochikohdavirus TaxID=2560160 RepID=A0A0E3XC00_9CAUD|nr:portal protein [Enterococcus phage EFLK1]QBZ69687.1 hypothetical protein [Enterococcus phage vB_EfaM_Ef2.1]QVW27915.1 hypothetical protein [Enterococcus phage MDA2]UQT00261.1 hypothetical protein EGEOBHOM_00109 [Enterococcus phage vB_OCPT_Car]BBE37082.1 hypothetical protein PHIEF17H_0130 [Enterococcus phage phiEF17H]BCN33084.1 hypothetical protein kochiEF7H_0130 [Enterococcus phage phi EF7H]BCN33288.1 hypothetical protein kochi14H1_0130 [Enterococcus phage phi EF14H1]BCN33492.1 hypothetic